MKMKSQQTVSLNIGLMLIINNNCEENTVKADGIKNQKNNE